MYNSELNQLGIPNNIYILEIRCKTFIHLEGDGRARRGCAEGSRSAGHGCRRHGSEYMAPNHATSFRPPPYHSSDGLDWSKSMLVGKISHMSRTWNVSNHPMKFLESPMFSSTEMTGFYNNCILSLVRYYIILVTHVGMINNLLKSQ